jgi:hypothetical protein
MDRLLRLLRSLGPAGAAANAHQLLEQRERDDFVVRSLTRRVAARTAAPVAGRPAARRAA